MRPVRPAPAPHPPLSLRGGTSSLTVSNRRRWGQGHQRQRGQEAQPSKEGPEGGWVRPRQPRAREGPREVPPTLLIVCRGRASRPGRSPPAASPWTPTVSSVSFAAPPPRSKPEVLLVLLNPGPVIVDPYEEAQGPGARAAQALSSAPPSPPAGRPATVRPPRAQAPHAPPPCAAGVQPPPPCAPGVQLRPRSVPAGVGGRPAFPGSGWCPAPAASVGREGAPTSVPVPLPSQRRRRPSL